MGSVAPQTLLEQIQQRAAGLTPLYYLNFMSDIAYVNGTNLGSIANIPSITGTLNLSSAGHTFAAAANGLKFPISGVTQPLTVVVEGVRDTDTGGVEGFAIVCDNTAAEQVKIEVSAADQFRFITLKGGVTQANVAASGTTIIGKRVRIAGRSNTDSVQTARTTDGGVVTMGTEDTLATIPNNPTHVWLGYDELGSSTPFRGKIREFMIINGAQNDATLQALANI